MQILYLLYNSSLYNPKIRFEVLEASGLKFSAFVTTRRSAQKFSLSGRQSFYLYSYECNNRYRRFADLPDDFPAYSEVLGDKLLGKLDPQVAEPIACDIFGRVEKFLQENCFDAFFGEYNGYISAVFFYFARKAKIPIFWPSNSPIKNNFFLTSSPHKYALEDEFRAKFDMACANRNESVLAAERYFETNQQLPHMETVTKNMNIRDMYSRFWDKIKTLSDIIYRSRESFEYTQIFKIGFRNSIIKAKNKLEANKRAAFFEHELNDVFRKNYLVYFLHHEPDLSLQVKAQQYYDQYYIIRNILLALPNDFKLIVREHPLSLSTRPTMFYERLKKLPGIVLVNDNVSKELLLSKTKAIITIRGTIAIEAAMQGVKVVSLGRHISENLDGVSVALGIEHMQELISNICNGKAEDEFCSTTRNKFINTLLEFQFAGTFHASKNAHMGKTSDYEAIADAINAYSAK